MWEPFTDDIEERAGQGRPEGMARQIPSIPCAGPERLGCLTRGCPESIFRCAHEHPRGSAPPTRMPGPRGKRRQAIGRDKAEATQRGIPNPIKARRVPRRADRPVSGRPPWRRMSRARLAASNTRLSPPLAEHIWRFTTWPCCQVFIDSRRYAFQAAGLIPLFRQTERLVYTCWK